MTPSELFNLWAPAESIWSVWAKPVLFAEMSSVPMASPLVLPSVILPQVDGPAAVVVDLPGRDSVTVGLALAQFGYRPVPCFNGTAGPSLDVANSAVVNVTPILTALAEGASMLSHLALSPEAPPAFLIDGNRRRESRLLAPGRFDNRWVVFPQDFPSATFLLQHGIRSILLVQKGGAVQPQSDLAHVLRRWQEARIPVLAWDPDTGSAASPLDIVRPSQFRAAWYRALTILGLRRNSAGGFGSIVPEPSSGGHG
jgi:hypothetical protein